MGSAGGWSLDTGGWFGQRGGVKRGFRRRWLIGSLGLAAVVCSTVACSDGSEEPAAPTFVWDGTVLGLGDTAEACFGGIPAALGAGCSGVVIRNWRWDEAPRVKAPREFNGVPLRESVAQITFRFDDGAITLTKKAEAAASSRVPACVVVGSADPTGRLTDSVIEASRRSQARAEGVYVVGAGPAYTMVDDRPVITLLVVADTPELRRWLTDTFGDGRVQVCPVARPVGR